jgi:DNA invertase Pin-like site-specific DNA recombinase
MKRKFSAVKGSDVREESGQELPETLGYGVAFIKTRAADSKIREMQLALEELGKEIGIELMDVIVDQTASRDIDREAVNDLCLWVENAPVSAIFVDFLGNITNDEADLSKFMQVMTQKGILIICLAEHSIYSRNGKVCFAYKESGE